MNVRKLGLVCLIVCTVIVILPLSIATVVIGALAPGPCDHVDVMGLDVAQYLLGLGIASLVTCVIMIISYILLMFESNIVAGVGGIVLIIISILNALFGIAWFIIGGIVLFRGNIDCIRNSSMHVVYALVLWCLSAFYFFKNCCSFRVIKTNSNNE